MKPLMRITDIDLYPFDQDTFMVNDILSMGIINDHLDDQISIRIKMNPTNQTRSFIYRRLWEDTYLKAPRKSYYDANEKQICLLITLSEAISYIYKATPPRLKINITDSLNSIDSIIELLKTFLMEDNGGQQVSYQAIFVDMIHFKAADSFFQYNTSGIELISEKDKNITKAYVMYSSESISDILAKNVTTDLMVMFRIPLNNPDYNVLYKMNIVAVKSVNNDSVYVVAYSLNVIVEQDKTLHDIIYDSYKNFI